MKNQKSPQEKKALSYKKDRRNGYGENDKASRKAIPLRKRLVNRQNRKRANDTISKMSDAKSTEEIEDSENLLNKKKDKVWRKDPDITLAEDIERSQKWSILREGRKKTTNLNYDDPRL